jgi:putative transposase
MPRPSRIILPGMPHHITQRGNYRQQVFYRHDDRRLYLDMLREYARNLGVSIHAYCLMDNHVHMIATPHDETGLPRMLQRLHSEYARALHARLRRVGHLWQARYGSAAMDEKHLWQAMVYVEQNPLRAGMVERAGDWRWSSAQAHLRNDDAGWLDLLEWRRRYTAESWKCCLELGLQDAMWMERVREATRLGWPMATESELEALETKVGRPLRPRRGGPTPNSVIPAIPKTYRKSLTSAAG